MFVARKAAAITPTNDGVIRYKGLYVGGAGSINVRMAGETANTTFVAVPVGTTLWINVQCVHATGTTATNIVGLL